MCMCIDFHTLNVNTYIDQYPILCIGDLLNQLHGICIFLKISLYADYH